MKYTPQETEIAIKFLFRYLTGFDVNYHQSTFISQYANRDPSRILYLKGPRQCGMTTLMYVLAQYETKMYSYLVDIIFHNVSQKNSFERNFNLSIVSPIKAYVTASSCSINHNNNGSFKFVINDAGHSESLISILEAMCIRNVCVFETSGENTTKLDKLNTLNLEELRSHILTAIKIIDKYENNPT